MKQYPVVYVTSRFQKFDDKKENAREHVVQFLDFMGTYAHGVALYMRENSKFLTDQAYTGMSIRNQVCCITRSTSSHYSTLNSSVLDQSLSWLNLEEICSSP